MTGRRLSLFLVLSCFVPDCVSALNPLHVDSWIDPATFRGSRSHRRVWQKLGTGKVPQQVAPCTTPTTPQQPNSYLEFLRFYLFYFGAIMALPGTPVGDLIHRRALSSANRPGDPYHHPLGAMNPQFALSTRATTSSDSLEMMRRANQVRMRLFCL